eukprot:TRINITY_DN18814_c0_g1_i1.p1 TRINITY_DN18814_c0_g1~~TRINITY_DN18814_c0_g1_i1.p1  ORF type:complete len:191 (+),score=37.18 TRINITY_DN18814_c0_g1_i1:214-786(+)
MTARKYCYGRRCECFGDSQLEEKRSPGRPRRTESETRKLLKTTKQSASRFQASAEKKLEELREENNCLREQLASCRCNSIPDYLQMVVDPDGNGGKSYPAVVGEVCAILRKGFGARTASEAYGKIVKKLLPGLDLPVPNRTTIQHWDELAGNVTALERKKKEEKKEKKASEGYINESRKKRSKMDDVPES